MLEEFELTPIAREIVHDRARIAVISDHPKLHSRSGVLRSRRSPLKTIGGLGVLRTIIPCHDIDTIDGRPVGKNETGAAREVSRKPLGARRCEAEGRPEAESREC